MMKIAVIGYSGSGKSTLARRLGQHRNAKVLHLDTLPYGGYFLMVAYMAAAWFILLCCRNVNEKLETFKPTGVSSACIALLFLWCLVSFSEVSTFLYFNF